MLAKVKDESPHDIVQAHTGREYVRYEWRFVPDGDDKVDDYLEYQEEEKPVTERPKPSRKVVKKGDA